MWDLGIRVNRVKFSKIKVSSTEARIKVCGVGGTGFCDRG